MAKGKKVSKKRVVKVESEGLAFIHASFNNIIISLCNRSGQVISWGSAGKAGVGRACNPWLAARLPDGATPA